MRSRYRKIREGSKFFKLLLFYRYFLKFVTGNFFLLAIYSTAHNYTGHFKDPLI